MLRIRDVCPGSRIRIFSIPDPGSRVKKIPDPGSGSTFQNLSILTQKIVSKLSEYDQGCLSRIRITGYGFWFFTHPGSRVQKGTGPRIQIHKTACYGTCLPPSRRACCRQFSRQQRRPRPCRGYRWRFRYSPPPSPRTQSKWISNIKNRYEKHFKQRERERGVFDLCRHDRVSQDVSDNSSVMKGNMIPTELWKYFALCGTVWEVSVFRKQRNFSIPIQSEEIEKRENTLLQRLKDLEEKN